MDRRMLSEQISGHRTKLGRKARDIWRKRSKGVLVVVRRQKGPGYGHQTLCRSHRNRRFQISPPFFLLFNSIQFNFYSSSPVSFFYSIQLLFLLDILFTPYSNWIRPETIRGVLDLDWLKRNYFPIYLLLDSRMQFSDPPFFRKVIIFILLKFNLEIHFRTNI